LRGHLPPRGTAPHQHRPRHRPRGAAVPLAASAALRLVILDLARLTWTFLWLSLICVGGGLGAIPELPRQVVDPFPLVTAACVPLAVLPTPATAVSDPRCVPLRGLPPPRPPRPGALPPASFPPLPRHHRQHHAALGDPARSAVGSSYRGRGFPRGHLAHGGG